MQLSDSAQPDPEARRAAVHCMANLCLRYVTPATSPGCDETGPLMSEARANLEK